MRAQGNADDWRLEMLVQLEQIRKVGFPCVEWATSGDWVVCPMCKARNGRIYIVATYLIELPFRVG